jgi:hypothetical protein
MLKASAAWDKKSAYLSILRNTKAVTELQNNAETVNICSYSAIKLLAKEFSKPLYVTCRLKTSHIMVQLQCHSQQPTTNRNEQKAQNSPPKHSFTANIPVGIFTFPTCIKQLMQKWLDALRIRQGKTELEWRLLG